MQIVKPIDTLISEVIVSASAVFVEEIKLDINLLNIDNSASSRSSELITYNDVTGMISFKSADYRGVILITFPAAAAFRIVTKLIGYEPAEINWEVREAIGRLVQKIADKVKARVEKHGIDFDASIANTLTGDHQIAVPRAAGRVRLNFESQRGDFFMEMTFKKD